MKRIVLCADGTWNVRDQKDKTTGKRRPTNVTKIARAILPRAGAVEQVVFYHDGVGTASGLDKYTGGAFGDGIEKNIQELYRSIMYNYVEGDELFFFGFSRGAFTVRTLAGFMNLVGLVEKGDDYWLPEIYGCYQKGKRPGSPEWTAAFKRFEYPPRPCPPITFVGVWDTVGALGAPGILGHLFNGKKYSYHDVSLNAHVLNAYHALAIDEHRKPFAPSVWKRPEGWTGTLEQAWFAGVHSDVGGSESPDGLANCALFWIAERASSHGLALDDAFLAHYRPCFNGTLHDSMTAMYRMMGTLNRAIGVVDDTERPHTAAMDRRAYGPSAYAPSNFDAYLKQHSAVTPYTTTRASREPCPDRGKA